MKISQKIREMIMRWEGCRLTAYRCPAGVLTIGYGHTGPDVTEGLTITAAQAVTLFNADVDRFAATMERILGDTAEKLKPQQFDALVSLAYNIGPGNFKKSTLLELVKNNPADPVIASEFLRHSKARNQNGKFVTLPGLVRRRTEEANHYFSDDPT